MRPLPRAGHLPGLHFRSLPVIGEAPQVAKATWGEALAAARAASAVHACRYRVTRWTGVLGPYWLAYPTNWGPS